jgi:hypothetical protein
MRNWSWEATEDGLFFKEVMTSRFTHTYRHRDTDTHTDTQTHTQTHARALQSEYPIDFYTFALQYLALVLILNKCNIHKRCGRKTVISVKL